MTTKADIRAWLSRAKKQGDTHMIVAYDSFDYEDFPIDVTPDDDVRRKIADLDNPNSMCKVMEVYNLSLDIERQLSEPLAWHL